MSPTSQNQSIDDASGREIQYETDTRFMSASFKKYGLDRGAAFGSKTGEMLRGEILQDREKLIQPDPDKMPRDSELSSTQYDNDLEKVKKSRLRVQNRLLEKNTVNSSDEEEEGTYAHKGKGKTMHFTL